MITINLELTEICVSRCRGCCNTFGYGDRLIDDTPEFYDFLRYSRSFCDKITFCGGDPLLHPNVCRILRESKELGYYVSLDTVGLPLLEDFRLDGGEPMHIDVGCIKDTVDMLGICFDGPNDDIACLFRSGYRNHIENQKRILGIAESNGLSVCINTVVHKGNEAHLKEIYDIISGYSCVRKWQLFEFLPIGDGGSANIDMFYTDTFGRSIQQLVDSIGSTSISICPKDSRSRNGQYAMVRIDGTVDIPTIGSGVSESIGNICDPGDYEKIKDAICSCGMKRK